MNGFIWKYRVEVPPSLTTKTLAVNQKKHQ